MLWDTIAALKVYQKLKTKRNLSVVIWIYFGNIFAFIQFAIENVPFMSEIFAYFQLPLEYILFALILNVM